MVGPNALAKTNKHEGQLFYRLSCICTLSYLLLGLKQVFKVSPVLASFRPSKFFLRIISAYGYGICSFTFYCSQLRHYKRATFCPRIVLFAHSNNLIGPYVFVRAMTLNYSLVGKMKFETNIFPSDLII